jgi:hypothetical protein
MRIEYAPLAVACALMVAATAQAAAATYTFDGTVSRSDIAEIAIGDAFSGSFTFESSSSDLGSGIYDIDMVINASVHGYFFSTTSPCDTCGGVSVVDNPAGQGTDRFKVSSYLQYPIYAPVTGSSLGGLSNYFLSLTLDDSTGTALSAQGLPSNLALSSFDSTEFNFAFLSGVSGLYVTGPLSNLTLAYSAPVPEASTSALLALGLGAVGVATRRRKTASSDHTTQPKNGS